MAEDIYQNLIERPKNVQVISFNTEQDYYEHPAYDDKLAILVSQIRIWKPSGTDWYDIPSNCLNIRECETIEIADNSKDLINKAVVRFPRGTVISVASRPTDKVVTGNPEEDMGSTESLKDATNDGEVVTPDASTYAEGEKKGESTVSMAITYDSKGIIEFNRTDKEPALLSPNDVAIGNRIEIRLGYAYSDIEFEEMNSSDAHENMPVVFTGFITSISTSTPLEIECTNMAYVLDCVSVPNVQLKNTLLIKDFLDDNGEYHILDDTGIQLADECKGQEISVSGGTLTDNLTIAEVLQKWNEAGIRSLIKVDHKTGIAKLHVGYAYYAGKEGKSLPNNDKKYITYKKGNNNAVTLLQFDWDVAEDKLSIKENDKKFLAVQATGRVKDGNEFKFFKVTVRKNPDKDGNEWIVADGDDGWQEVNLENTKERKKAKYIDGNLSTKVKDRRIKNKVDLKRYTVIPYMSLKVDITQDELIEEAKQYWGKLAPNGITGHLTIFGDVMVDPTDIVGLCDLRHPERNGYYYVEAVNTTFGVNGYRRELTLPFRMCSLKINKI